MATNMYVDATGKVYKAASANSAADQLVPVVASDHLANLTGVAQDQEVVKKLTFSTRKITFY